MLRVRLRLPNRVDDIDRDHLQTTRTFVDVDVDVDADVDGWWYRLGRGSSTLPCPCPCPWRRGRKGSRGSDKGIEMFGALLCLCRYRWLCLCRRASRRMGWEWESETTVVRPSTCPS